jgi:hypothetical protein
MLYSAPGTEKVWEPLVYRNRDVSEEVKRGTVSTDIPIPTDSKQTETYNSYIAQTGAVLSAGG